MTRAPLGPENTVALDDLAMVRACTEALDIGCYEVSGNRPEHTIRLNGSHSPGNDYWPFKNDAQALALAFWLADKGELIIMHDQVMFNSDDLDLSFVAGAATAEERRRVFVSFVAAAWCSR